MTLSAADHQTSSQSANFIASIAAIEIPRNDWPELMTTLVDGVQSGPKSLKLGSYKAIEYICETVVRPFQKLVLMAGPGTFVSNLKFDFECRRSRNSTYPTRRRYPNRRNQHIIFWTFLRTRQHGTRRRKKLHHASRL